MEIFGIGPLELLFILLIMLIVLGPKDMVKTGQRLGRMIRNLTRSPTWIAMMNTSREIREMPTRLVRESGLEEEVSEISKLRNLPAQFLRDADIANLPPASPPIPSNGQDASPEIEEAEETPKEER